MEDNIRSIIENFKEISKIPRGSGNEKQISDWLKAWAQDKGFIAMQDEFHNLLIKVPGTGKYKNFSYKKGYILQGHLDMVCQKSNDSSHDFTQDPVIPLIKDGLLMTNGQITLGADNGIAIAIAMFLATNKNMDHPPLELLFTVDEETGLVGALNLKSDWLEAQKLINIDSEEDNKITIGCAGSRDVTINKKYILKNNIPEEMSLVSISITGGKGGHSGVMIDQKIANAHILLARILYELSNKIEINLSSWNGGTFRNAITGEVETIILINKDDFKNIKSILIHLQSVIDKEYKKVENNLKVNFTIIESKNISKQQYLSQKDSKEIIRFILSIPHGVLAMSNEVKGLVETSNNLAIIKLTNGQLEINCMHRSSVMSSLDYIDAKLTSLGQLINADVTYGNASPAWQPNPNSQLLKIVYEAYKKEFNSEVIIEAIHAGLECGVIGDKYTGMEMVSIGPNITGAHTTKETLEINSIEKIVKWLYAIFNYEK